MLSYYQILGVRPAATEQEIRAHYILLMRRYHPDVSRSPLAHARAAEITDAYRVLTDPAARAGHEAELGRRRAEVVSARAADLAREQGRRALTIRRRRGRARFAARLAAVAVVLAVAFAGWQLPRMVFAPGLAMSLGAGDEDGDTRAAVAALSAASAREARAMPPVSSAAVAGGVRAYRRLAAAGDAAQLRTFSDRCHARAADVASWDALDFCVAYDQAAFVANGAIEGGYFTDRHDRAAHFYVTRLSNLDVIGDRLERIRGLVAPAVDEGLQANSARLLHRVVKRGRRFAGVVRDALYPSRDQRVAGARDF